MVVCALTSKRATCALLRLTTSQIVSRLREVLSLERVGEHLRLGAPFPGGVVVTAPAGTGKTSVLQHIAHQFATDTDTWACPVRVLSVCCVVATSGKLMITLLVPSVAPPGLFLPFLLVWRFSCIVARCSLLAIHRCG